MPIQPIYRLPATLQTYKTTKLDSAPGTCVVCHRAFNEYDDPDDPQEIPCAPLQLSPCGHLIGSECLEAVRSRGFNSCLLCTTPIAMAHDSLLLTFASFLANRETTQDSIDRALTLSFGLVRAPRPWNVLHPRSEQAAMAHCSERVFGKNATYLEAATLWYLYVKLFLLRKLLTRINGVSAIALVFLTAVDWACGMHFEGFLLPIQLSTWPWVLRMGYNVGFYVILMEISWKYFRLIAHWHLFIVSWWRVWVLVFGWKWVAVYVLLRAAVLLAWLAVTVAHGVKVKGKTERKED